MIKVYGLANCNQCKGFCSILKNRNIIYEYIENESLITELGEKHSILSAPIVEIDSNFYNSRDAIAYINEHYN